MAVEEKREEEKDEGAPEVETPETKRSTPSDRTPRDEQAPLETPESPAPKRSVAKRSPSHRETHETRGETRIVSREEFVDALVAESKESKIRLHPLPKAPDVQVIAQLAASAPTVTDPYVTSLFQHVAAHPVDAHAPAWAAHTPNQTGANTSGGFS